MSGAMRDQSLPEALGRRLLRTSVLRLTRLEEGDGLPVDVGKPLDKDKVTCVVEDAAMDTRKAQVRRRRDRAGGQDRVGKLE